MRLAYLIVLAVCTVAVFALVARRLVELGRGHRPRPSTARIFNEWTWTVIPLGVLIALLWLALK